MRVQHFLAYAVFQSILHQFKGKVDITETAGHAGVGFEPAMGQLISFDNNHKVCNQRIVHQQLGFGGGGKVVDGTDLDELTLKEKCSFLLHLTA